MSCHQCPNGSIQLVGGNSRYEGRIEVCEGGCWGPVCIGDGGWSSLDAAVACRQLNMHSQGIGRVVRLSAQVHYCPHHSQGLFPDTTTLFHYLPCWLLTAQGVSLLCSAVYSLCAMKRTTTMLEWSVLQVHCEHSLPNSIILYLM